MTGGAAGVEWLVREWTTLQPLHERYEWAALGIKLTALVLFFAAIVAGLQGEWIGVLMVLLWLQEGITKTFQARLGQRLLQVERALSAGAAGKPPPPPCQLHAGWLASRRGTVGQIAEYARSAARPTVAFPYLLLLLAAWW